MESYNENPKQAKVKEFFKKVLEKLHLTHFLVILLVGVILAVAYQVSVMDRPISPFTKTDQTGEAADGPVKATAVGKVPYGSHDPVIYTGQPQSWVLSDLFSSADLMLAGFRKMGGNYESDACEVTVGWACDPDDFTKTIGVHFYTFDLLKNAPSKFIGSTTAKYSRKDVSGYPTVASACGNISNKHGFIFVIPESVKTGENVTIAAYAIDYTLPGQTWSGNPRIGSKPITIKCKANLPGPYITNKPVYYLKNKTTKAYYYTISAARKTQLLASGGWIYGGVAFYAYDKMVEGFKRSTT